MILNYCAFPDKGGMFAFSAKDDEDAKALVLDYLRENGEQFRSSIFRWSKEKKNWDFEDKELRVEITEPKLPQEQEYKLEVTYIKYVRVTGVMTEDKFCKDSKHAAETLLTLPEHRGWVKMYERCTPTWCSDDDRYHVKESEVETIKIGEKPLSEGE